MNLNLIVRVNWRKYIKFGRVIGHVSNITNTMTYSENNISPFEEYLRFYNCPHGPLFWFKCGKPISAFYLNSSLKCLLNVICLDTHFDKGFRIRVVTFAAARCTVLALIQNMGRWKSNAFNIIYDFIIFTFWFRIIKEAYSVHW